MKSVSKKANMFAASRFVLPEHRELYLKYKEEERFVPQPVLEEDELAEINYRIIDSQQYDYAVTICWWQRVRGELGQLREIQGWVRKLDPVAEQLKLENEQDVQWISLGKIVSVKEG